MLHPDDNIMTVQENRIVSETVLDQGTVWWPAGLTGQEKLRVVFNVALEKRPEKITCDDYENRQPINVEVLDIEKSGTRNWERYTAATLRFPQSSQQGRSFRWRAWGEE